MNYKKVKLLDESGNEELYPETDWSIVKNSPINTGNDGITINKKGRNILLRSRHYSNKKHRLLERRKRICRFSRLVSPL